jgi:hypothetical protein
MKTYLQMDGDQLVEYVDKREHDGLKFSFNAVSAERDTFEAQRNVARNQLSRICEEGFNNDDTIGLEPADDYILRKLAELKQALNQQLQDVVKRMEAVDIKELRDEYSETIDDELHSFEDRNESFMTEDLINPALKAVRARLIQAAKGEQP